MIVISRQPTLNVLLFFIIAITFAACQEETGLPAAKAEGPNIASIKAEEAVSNGSAAGAAETLHQAFVTIDSHIDIPISLGLGDADPSITSPMQVDIPSMRSGGLDAGFFVVYVGQGAVDEAGYAQAYEKAQLKFEAIDRMLEGSPEDIVLVRSPKELEEAVKDGKLAAAIGVENAYPLGPNFEHLQEFYDRGARYVSLTHFGHNHFADSSVAKGEQNGIAEPVNEGVSLVGLALIDEMNRLGIMVDVSHTSPASVMVAVAHSKTPVIASHSSVKSLNAHPRNLSDLEIKAIAARGGVIQLVAFDAYLRQISEEELEAAQEIQKELGLDTPLWYQTASQTEIDELRQRKAALHARWPRTTVADFVDHIDYIANLAGVDAVGIASDFGGGGGVEGWDYIIQTPAVTEELLSRGYSRSQIQKIWGGNLLRVWQAAENYAQKSAQ